MQRDSIIDFLKEYEGFHPEIIRRELTVPVDGRHIISVIGPRRAGKTYFLLSLRSSFASPLYLNFEDTRLGEVSFKELRDVIRVYVEVYGRQPDALLLDEVQNIDNWERAVRELHDLKKYPIVLTGSSSKLLSREIATQLRGRTISFLLLPFSFREFLAAKGVDVGKYMTKDREAGVRGLLNEYLEFGGFPDVVLGGERIRLLREYQDLVLFRDFVERHGLRNIGLARFMVNFFLQNFSSEMTLNSIYKRARAAGIRASKDTVYEYVRGLEDTVFFFFLDRFSLKAHLRESYPKKVYLCDTGLAKPSRYSPDRGKLMENAVFLELMRRRNHDPALDLFYLKDALHQVDFIVKRGERLLEAIQVTYADSREGVERREITSLLWASKHLDIERLTVITWDYEEEASLEGRRIQFIPLWRWLLEVEGSWERPSKGIATRLSGKA